MQLLWGDVKLKVKMVKRLRKELSGWKYFDLKVLLWVSWQEWRSVKSKESRPLLTPDEPNRGRAKVSKCFASCCSATLHVNFLLIPSWSFIFICNFDFFLFVPCFACPLFSHWLLWFRPTTPPKPSPTSPASRHHSNQRASAAGLFTGRAPKKKTLSPVVQHYPQCLFQEMRLFLPYLFFFFFPSVCTWRVPLNHSEDLKNTLFFSCVFLPVNALSSSVIVPHVFFSVCLFLLHVKVKCLQFGKAHDISVKIVILSNLFMCFKDAAQ